MPEIKKPSPEDIIVTILVYNEHFTHIEHAIEREKELKKWSRKKKEALIATTNPEWLFLNKDVG